MSWYKYEKPQNTEVKRQWSTCLPCWFWTPAAVHIITTRAMFLIGWCDANIPNGQIIEPWKQCVAKNLACVRIFNTLYSSPAAPQRRNALPPRSNRAAGPPISAVHWLNIERGHSMWRSFRVHLRPSCRLETTISQDGHLRQKLWRRGSNGKHPRSSKAAASLPSAWFNVSF